MFSRYKFKTILFDMAAAEIVQGISEWTEYCPFGITAIVKLMEKII